jgi:hypothetical protein
MEIRRLPKHRLPRTALRLPDADSAAMHANQVMIGEARAVLALHRHRS